MKWIRGRPEASIALVIVFNHVPFEGEASAGKMNLARLSFLFVVIFILLAGYGKSPGPIVAGRRRPEASGAIQHGKIGCYSENNDANGDGC